MEKIDKAIEILTAFKEGKIIEIYDKDKWKEFTNPTDSRILWYLAQDIKIRVKPQPTYRPYANAEEFLKDNIKHGGWFKKWCNNNLFFTPYHIDNVKSAIYFKNCKLDCWAHFKDLCESYVWADDNSPCGILEE